MSQSVTINGVTYSQPDQGTSPPWGDTQAEIIVALANPTMTGRTIDGDDNTITDISNSSIKAAAGISVNKLAALTASRAVVSDGSGFITQATTTATEIGYVNGVTSAIQTQMNTKLTDPMTTNADLITRAAGVPARLPIGTNGQVLSVSGGAPAWASIAGTGDVVGPASSVNNGIAAFDGTTGKLLKAGPVITDWTSFTPTGSWSTNTTYTGYYRRMFQNLEIRYNIALSGAPTSADLTLNIPLSVNMNSTRLLGTTEVVYLGSGLTVDASATDIISLVAVYNSATTVLVKYLLQSVVIPVRTANVNATAPFTFATSDILQVTIDVPITEYL